MNIQALINEKVSQALEAAGAPAGSPAAVRQSAKPQFGDYQANGVMGAAKKLKTNPRELATKVVESLTPALVDAGIAEKIELAGPGFINIHLSNQWISDVLNTLYQNNGDGTFKDITDKAGVGGGEQCSVGAVWLDFDNDGLLDLYVGNYLNYDPDYSYYYAPDGFPGPLAYDSQKDILFKNMGNSVFKDVTEQMGIADIDGRAMGVGAADYDDDGFVDIYVANDHTVNYLWHNDQGNGFSDKGTLSGTGFSQAGEATVSMSVDFADYNHDELLDIFISFKNKKYINK